LNPTLGVSVAPCSLEQARSSLVGHVTKRPKEHAWKTIVVTLAKRY
jgi:hypothetical protein